jgi:glycosyltransferase involved in cell wall biosynthesis
LGTILIVTRTAILSLSPIARDRRVLRQCAIVAERGEMAVVIGYGSAKDQLPWPFEAIPLPLPNVQHRLSTVIRQVPAWTGLTAARCGFWAAARHRQALAALRKHAPDIIVASDWPALVIAARYKQEHPCLILFDSHEFAPLEFEERLWWRMVYKPFVTALEADTIGSADAISTVGPGIAQAMQSFYALPETPNIIRNVADRIALPERAAQWPLNILYHGYILPDRGLEALIDSVAQWHLPHQLTIRGDGATEYLTALKTRASRSDKPEQIRFEPGVALDNVLIAASASDLGVFFTPLESEQRAFGLPNKLFEYICAGLAVAISPGPDMRTIVNQYGVGVVSRDPGSIAIAEAINGLTQQSVEGFRSAARIAAMTLNWEHESRVLTLLLDRLTAQGRGT